MTQDTGIVVREETALALPGDDLIAGLEAVRSVLAPDLTAMELRLFAMVSSRSGLDPFARQIFAVKRQGKVSFQTGIDGYRSIAARTGQYDGQDEPTFGEPCTCGMKPIPHPVSSTVRVYRKDMTRSVAATAFWHEYVPVQTFMWEKMPHVMLAKVAEALALRKAFPWDPTQQVGIGADLYTTEEMAQAERPPLAERLAARVSGMSIGDFRIATKDIEAAYIREVAEELFPSVPAAQLTPENLETLAVRLLAPDELEDEGEGEAEEEAPQPVLEAPQGCPSVSNLSGATCTLKAGHLGVHRNGRTESWSAVSKARAAQEDPPGEDD